MNKNNVENGNKNNIPLLQVNNLKTYFYTNAGVSKAVDGVSFSLKSGEILGIVGESGSGKSISSLSILRLIELPGKIVDGEVIFKGEDILKKSKSQMRLIRGNDISMIFQEPMTSLNPVYTIGEQISEVIRLHQKLNRKEAWKKAIEMLKLVGIPSPEQRAKQEPYELSGGMRQRVMIAIALACQPNILIADEPTTALDVTIQAQIIDLMKSLQKKFGMGIIFITHDLGVVSEICNRIAVMYAGKIVEYTDKEKLFNKPKHPYTKGLLNSMPSIHLDSERLSTIPGNVPNSKDIPPGCSFAPRCSHAKDICFKKDPVNEKVGEYDYVRCWMYSKEWDEPIL